MCPYYRICDVPQCIVKCTVLATTIKRWKGDRSSFRVATSIRYSEFILQQSDSIASILTNFLTIDFLTPIDDWCNTEQAIAFIYF